MYKAFIKTKQMFNIYGIEVNVVISRSSIWQLILKDKEEKWTISFYGYSDLYGLPPKFQDISIGSVYYHRRKSLISYNKDIEKMKAEIDKDIIEKNYQIIAFSAGENQTFDYLS